jgi:dihydropteroate synthase
MGVDYIRTHDVRALNDALKMFKALNLRGCLEQSA